MNRHSDEFVALLTASQSTLYACILSLLADRVAAQDVLQEVNLTLWHKSREFEPGSNFAAWSNRIARYHVLNHRRKVRRDRLIFDDEFVAELCDRQSARDEDLSQYAGLLRECLGKLPEDQRELLAARYAPGGTVKQIAALRGQSSGAISQALYRIRESLLNCVSQQLGGVMP